MGSADANPDCARGRSGQTVPSKASFFASAITRNLQPKNKPMKTISNSAAACRRTARALGVLVIAFIVFTAIAEGMANPFAYYRSA